MQSVHAAHGHGHGHGQHGIVTNNYHHATTFHSMGKDMTKHRTDSAELSPPSFPLSKPGNKCGTSGTRIGSSSFEGSTRTATTADDWSRRGSDLSCNSDTRATTLAMDKSAAPMFGSAKDARPVLESRSSSFRDRAVSTVRNVGRRIRPSTKKLNALFKKTPSLRRMQSEGKVMGANIPSQNKSRQQHASQRQLTSMPAAQVILIDDEGGGKRRQHLTSKQVAKNKIPSVKSVLKRSSTWGGGHEDGAISSSEWGGTHSACEPLPSPQQDGAHRHSWSDEVNETPAGAGSNKSSSTGSGTSSASAAKTKVSWNEETTTTDNASRAKRRSIAICDGCHNPTGKSYLTARDKKYHAECFRCMGCHDFIDPSEPFAFTTVDEGGGVERPMHKQCHTELFGKKCTLCFHSIPKDKNGKTSYIKHPFFDDEIICPHHAETSRRCTSCHRFEPTSGPGFVDLEDDSLGGGDNGKRRCACYSCCRTLVVDNADAGPLWDKVMRFFLTNLNLPLWEGMRNVPVLIVGQEVLNEQSIQSAVEAEHGHGHVMTRGLCLSEHHSSSSSHHHHHHHHPPMNDANSTGVRNFEPPSTQGGKSITAILCLSGLPADLTASILAHEATHAWIKLHPEYNANRPIPPEVEEGCCQLVAYLLLSDGLEESPRDAAATSLSPPDNFAEGPSDHNLRQYFKFTIETDENEVYGVGFRRASRAYAALGIEVLMNHVVTQRAFPMV